MALSQILKELWAFQCFHEVAAAILDLFVLKIEKGPGPPSAAHGAMPMIVESNMISLSQIQKELWAF